MANLYGLCDWVGMAPHMGPESRSSTFPPDRPVSRKAGKSNVLTVFCILSKVKKIQRHQERLRGSWNLCLLLKKRLWREKIKLSIVLQPEGKLEYEFNGPISIIIIR